jgi:uncharacterized membrane protein YdjX (TVP38/TMEM64 family)
MIASRAQSPGVTRIMVATTSLPRRLIVPAILIAVIVAAWSLGLTDLLTWAGLAREHAVVTAWVASHPLIGAALFLLIYVATVTLSLPQAGLLTLTGGLLFGTIAGGLLAVAGATIGAVFLFLIARSAFGEPLARRGGATLGKLRDGLRRDGFSYLLALRLIPVVPFWLINLAAALGGMRLRPFVLATLLGILPATFVTAWIGAGLSRVLDQGGKPDLGILFSFPVLGPLVALAALSLVPVIWRNWRGRDA